MVIGMKTVENKTKSLIQRRIPTTGAPKQRFVSEIKNG